MGKKFSLPKPSKAMLKKRVDINFKSTLLWSIVMLVAAVGVLGYGGYIWVDKVAKDSDQIFYSMVAKSLETSSVSKVVTQNESGRKDEQKYQLSFSPSPLVHTDSRVEQVTQSRETSIVQTEMIGLKDNDYVRYTDVSIPKTEGDANDYSKLLNTWAKRTPNTEQGEETQFLNEAIFGFIPFGNFNQADREKLVTMIKQKKVYELSPGKLTYEDYRPVLNVTAQVNPRQLITVMQEYSKISGIGNAAKLNPEDYQDDNVFVVNLKIDPISRHLRQINYPESTRAEKYVGYGTNKAPKIPTNPISIEELQGKIK